MPKYLVETISTHRMRYVVEAKCAEHATDEVCNFDENLCEFSQLHIGENLTGVREIDNAEYLRVFDEDNEYLKEWDDHRKFNFVNIVVYPETDN